ncbi:MAG: hypothetical protein IBX57_00915 [Gammaproteobacteria bacterium]|nr:hypothetical protein [Gammaproteobacteria bacterium]
MANKPLIFKFPLDLTGKSPDNLVMGEPHTLPTGQLNRAVVPNYGAFFSESLVVTDADTGIPLVPHEQFKAVQLYQEATLKSGLEVCSVVLVTDPNVSSNILIDYQAIGGEFSYSVIALRIMLDELNLDERPVQWGDVLGKPLYFPPSPHLHDAGDIYGFEYLVEVLERIRYAILVGNEAALLELRQYIEGVEDEIKSFLYPKATDEQAIAGEDCESVIAPCTAKKAFDVWADTYLENQEELTRLNDHLSQYNPHGDTAASIGLGALEGQTLMTAIQGHGFVVDLLGGSEAGLHNLELLLYPGRLTEGGYPRLNEDDEPRLSETSFV